MGRSHQKLFTFWWLIQIQFRILCKQTITIQSNMSHVGRILSNGGIFSGIGELSVPLNLFFVQATIIISVCRALSLLGHYLRQPRVIFEIIGGILLGPSAIGRDSYFAQKIFPSSSIPYLSIVANIGLTFYLFLVGLELDLKLLATHGKKAGVIAIMGMAVPFVLGKKEYNCIMICEAN